MFLIIKPGALSGLLGEKLSSSSGIHTPVRLSVSTLRALFFAGIRILMRHKNFIQAQLPSWSVRILAAGNPHGIIKLYGLADFKLVYQFALQDSVFDLCFAPDSRRLYDIRGSYGNVWEPDVLLHLSASAEGLSDTEERIDTAALRIAGDFDSVTASAAQPSGCIYCFGTKSGLMKILETTTSTVLELRNPEIFMGIQHVAWSDDGKYISFTDLSRTIFFNSVSRTLGPKGFW